MAQSLRFFQIYYRPEQLSELYTFAEAVSYPLTEFFENSVIKKLVPECEEDKIAVCSWKLKQKMRWNIRRPRELTTDVLKTDFQVMSFTGNTRYHQMINAAEAWHPGFKVIMSKILKNLGEAMPEEVKNPIYQNHFCATRQVYQQYVFEYLSPAMILMNNDPELKELCWRDSKYTNLAKKDAADSDYLKEKIGVPYYPMHPFILERLFPIFCHNRKIKVEYL